jgi:hypothetical protein
MNKKKLYEYNIKGLELKEFLELKNNDDLWEVVDDDIFKTIYENSSKNMSKINDFVLLMEETGVIKTNIQDIFKEESGQYISHKFLLTKLLYNMGREFFDKIEKEQNNWMYAILSFETAILIDNYDVSSYYLLLVCNIKAGEKEEIEKNYKRFKKNIEELKEKDYRLYKEQEELINTYEETYNNFIEEKSNKEDNTVVDNSSKEFNKVEDNSENIKEQGKAAEVVEKPKRNKGSNINKILIGLVVIALITSTYSVVKVREHEDRITSIGTDTFVNSFKISGLKNDKAYQSLYETGFDTIKNNNGSIFFIIIRDFEDFGNGIKITYEIGNPYNVKYQGFDISVNSTHYDEDSNSSSEYGEKTKSYTNSLNPGWNEFSMTLQDFDLDKFESVTFSNFKTKSIIIYNN